MKMENMILVISFLVLLLAWQRYAEYKRLQFEHTELHYWSEGLGAIGAPNAGLTYVKHSGRFYGADYCNVEGYGVPAGELDAEDGHNWLNDPACERGTR